MIMYSVFMFIIAAVFALVSIKIYRGNTNLIHAYHQSNVQDKAAYGKAFGKALFILSAAPLLSGMIGLFADSDSIATTAVTVLIIGIACGISCIITVQKKYNNGMF